MAILDSEIRRALWTLAIDASHLIPVEPSEVLVELEDMVERADANIARAIRLFGEKK